MKSMFRNKKFKIYDCMVRENFISINKNMLLFPNHNYCFKTNGTNYTKTWEFLL